MKCKVIVFPGSNCDSDCFYVLEQVCGQEVEYVWHKEESVGEADLIVIPGGFSYGDYLRTGSIARFSPIMQDVIRFANSGGAVIGICNGFQILLESGLLPGAMLRNKTLKFICRDVYLKPINLESRFTRKMTEEQTLRIPIAHGEGNYYCDDEVLKELEDNDRIAFRYSSHDGDTSEEHNPNGSRNNIAGILNKGGNVLGMMPHPERACEEALGSEDGKYIWESIFEAVS